jgi:hypothetical protein
VKNLPTSPQSLRISAIFQRKPTTPWTAKEIRAYKAIGIVPEEDLAALEARYAAEWPPDSGKNTLRHDLGTFLNNFPAEIERARTHKKPTPPGKISWLTPEQRTALPKDHINYRPLPTERTQP